MQEVITTEGKLFRKIQTLHILDDDKTFVDAEIRTQVEPAIVLFEYRQLCKSVGGEKNLKIEEMRAFIDKYFTMPSDDQYINPAATVEVVDAFEEFQQRHQEALAMKAYEDTVMKYYEDQFMKNALPKSVATSCMLGVTQCSYRHKLRHQCSSMSNSKTASASDRRPSVFNTDSKYDIDHYIELMWDVLSRVDFPDTQQSPSNAKISSQGIDKFGVNSEKDTLVGPKKAQKLLDPLLLGKRDESRDVKDRSVNRAKSHRPVGFTSLLPLPYPYIVPGGRFREIYYWDSYFTCLGLIASKRYEFVEHMVNNIAYMIEKYGHMPNGNRSYYTSRSQPPFFCHLVLLLETVKSGVIHKYIHLIEKEYEYWMHGLQYCKSACRKFERKNGDKKCAVAHQRVICLNIRELHVPTGCLVQNLKGFASSATISQLDAAMMLKEHSDDSDKEDNEDNGYVDMSNYAILNRYWDDANPLGNWNNANDAPSVDDSCNDNDETDQLFPRPESFNVDLQWVKHQLPRNKDENVADNLFTHDVYREDTSAHSGTDDTSIRIRKSKELLTDIRAAAESGWDFSSRWFDADERNVAIASNTVPVVSQGLNKADEKKGIITTQIIPVDLNVLLYVYEQTLAQYYAVGYDHMNKDPDPLVHDSSGQDPILKSVLNTSPSGRDLRQYFGSDKYASELHHGDTKKSRFYFRRMIARYRAMQAYFWNEEKKFFFDFNLKTMQQHSVWSLAGCFPLTYGTCTEDQASSIAAHLDEKFLHPGGLVTTWKGSDGSHNRRNTEVEVPPWNPEHRHQWDFPNGWAPLQYQCAQGLIRYGYLNLATKVIQRWQNTVRSGYDKYGKIMEKYNVVTGGATFAVGGEYTVQEGFGWTNGVYVSFEEICKKLAENKVASTRNSSPTAR